MPFPSGCPAQCRPSNTRVPAWGGLGQSGLGRVGKAGPPEARDGFGGSPQYSRTPANSSQRRRLLVRAWALDSPASDGDPSQAGLEVPLRPQGGAGGGGVVEQARRSARREADRSPSVAGEPREGVVAEDGRRIAWRRRAGPKGVGAAALGGRASLGAVQGGQRDRCGEREKQNRHIVTILFTHLLGSLQTHLRIYFGGCKRR